MTKKTVKKSQVLTAAAAVVVEEIHALHRFAASFSEAALLHLGYLLYALRQEFPTDADYSDYCAAEFGMAKKTALEHAKKFAGLRANPALMTAARQSPQKAIALTGELVRRGETQLPDADDLALANLLALPPVDMVKAVDRLLKDNPPAERQVNPVAETQPAPATDTDTAVHDAAAGLALQKALSEAAETIQAAETALDDMDGLSGSRRKKILAAVDTLYGVLDGIAPQLASD